MSQSGLAYELSEARGTWLMRIGPPEGPPILIVPPLFEEMNRMRALIAAVMRNLAARGHGCWLPDLKGSGESESTLESVEWDDWRHDVSAAADWVRQRSGQAPLILAIRGGCLIDDAAEAIGWWRLAPVAGRSLVRDMVRAGLAGVEWAGYAPSAEFRKALEAAEPVAREPMRILRLISDAAASDAKLPGPALWRRSEPGQSNELAEAIADDVAAWAMTCARS